MLPGITQQLFRKAVFSVGSVRGAERPLSPIEVSSVFHAAIKAGATRKEISQAFTLDPSMVARFLRLKDLSTETHHLVDWGTSKESAIGFSTASELCRAPRAIQSELAAAILRHGATKDETISVIQLHQRSGESLNDCISRVLARRPTVKVFQLIMGAIASAPLHKTLAALSQMERDKALLAVLASLYPKMNSFTAKLGDRQFTVVGEKSVTDNIANDKAFESNINVRLVDMFMHKGGQQKGTS